MYLHCITDFLKLRKNIFYHFVNISSIVLIVLSLFTDLIFSKMRVYFFGAYPIAAILHPLILVYLASVCIFCLSNLFSASYGKSSKNFNSDDINRNKYVFWAFLIGNLGSIDFVQNYGIEFYPFGAVNILFFSIIMTYAIVRHNLLDINLVIKRGLLYSCMISAISLLYILSALLLENFIRGAIGYKSLILTVITIILTVLVFQPLKNYVQNMIDKLFYKGTIDQINEQNLRLREELQKNEKLKAVATLAAGMAHEIKNPLTSIKTFTEYLPQKGTDPAFREKFHHIVGHEVERINHIVRQLLEFSKPSDLDLRESDINKLLDETLDLLNNDFLKYNIKVQKQYTPLPPINIDPSQMKQVFLNLFLNAVDAMPTGGTITIQTNTINPTNAMNPINSINNPRHTTYDIRNTNPVAITITDTGHGIAKEDLKHIFDPFFTKKEGGTGLGLSVVHGIIEKHGGHINVSSRLDYGTIFTITLPLNFKK